jgi:hypothetical protein
MQFGTRVLPMHAYKSKYSTEVQEREEEGEKAEVR